MRLSIILLIMFTLPMTQLAHSENHEILSASSPANRVALLELYTSEGCSSCPPSDRWLSSLKQAGVSSRQIIPLAFHVTYWDYIGWSDRFADSRYDERQRRIVAHNKQRTIYTPQFVLGGDDYRSSSHFSSDINELISQPSLVDLTLSASITKTRSADVSLSVATGADNMKEVSLYMTVYENDLHSQVDDGENEGEVLHHDYVVRRLYGPFKPDLVSGQAMLQQSVVLDNNWKLDDLYLVAFAQHVQTGKVLQAVQLALGKDQFKLE